MMKIKIVFAIMLSACLSVSAQESKCALVLIDIQDFYFSGGNVELVDVQEVGLIAAKVLQVCRDTNMLIVHVKHKVESEGDINIAVEPLDDEKVIEKEHVNAFKETELDAFLKNNSVKELIIIGMQTHLCLEAAVRQACDIGYKVTVVEDACTTRDVEFNDHIINAKDVHDSTLATLRSYCDVIRCKVFEKKFLN